MTKIPNLFWNTPSEHLLKILESRPEGLSSLEAKKRLRKYGPNQVFSKKRGGLSLFLRHFQSPLVILLLLSAGLTIMMGNPKSATIIICIILSSIFIDFIQEYKARNSLISLRSLIASSITAFRDGEKIKVPIVSLVPGDIIELSAGDLIPGDGIILSAKDFFVNQSALSGESIPVEKRKAAPSITSPLDSPNSVLGGTSVISGWARVLICHTGVKTILGSTSVQEVKPSSALMIGTKQLGILLIQITSGLMLLTLVANLFLQRPWPDIILFSIALGIGLTPQLLNAIISITFARFSILLSKQKVIVRKLSAIYDLGTMDVLCTDKTGTLTEAHIKMEEACDWQGNRSPRTFLFGYLNSFLETGYKSPLDDAILAHKIPESASWKKLDELPFDANHRHISVLASNGKENYLILKGPLEDILNKCEFLECPHNYEASPLSASGKEKIQDLFRCLSKEGLRVLGVAYKLMSQDQRHVTDKNEERLIFVGYITFSDQPKKSAKKAIQLLSYYGTQLKIITGDNEYVTKHLCAKLSIPIHDILLGEEINSMPDAILQKRVEKTNIYCRITPPQKRRIVQALQANDHIVGFLGDGINDLEAFFASNASISVHNAVPAAKEAASFVLLDRNLETLHQAILEARRAFNNIVKYMMTGISSNFGNMISMVGASFVLPFLPMLPIQILLNNFLYDLSEIGIPYDRVDANFYIKPPKWDINFMRNFMFIFGPLSSLFDFFVFFILLKVFAVSPSLFQTAWFIESLVTQILMIFIVRTRKTLSQSKPHMVLILTAILSIIIGIVFPYTTYASYFGFVPLPFSLLGILALIAILYVLMTEITKRAFYASTTVKVMLCKGFYSD